MNDNHTKRIQSILFHHKNQSLYHKSTERLDYLDVAKGIAILCIILGHLGSSAINRVVFTFHVPIFYFITGYFVNNRKPLKQFIAEKAKRLLIPYFLTSLIIILCGTCVGAIKGDPVSAFTRWTYAAFYGAGDSYSKPFVICTIGAIWFLWASFWGCLFLRISLYMNAYLRPFFIILLFCIGYYSRAWFWFPFSIQAGACATLFMYIGYLIHKYEFRIAQCAKAIKLSGIVVACAVWFMFIKNFQSFWLVHCDIGRGVIDIIGCICACAVVVMISQLLCKHFIQLANALMYIGRHSLMVLCLHAIELIFFPWWTVTSYLTQLGAPAFVQLSILIIGKLLFILCGMQVLIQFQKKLYNR